MCLKMYLMRFILIGGEMITDANSRLRTLSLALLACSALSCGQSKKKNPEALLLLALGQTASYSDVLDHYADLAYYSYDQSYQSALQLQEAANSFSPNKQSDLTNLQNLWVEARARYMATEAFRFSGGPIDTASLVGCGSGSDYSGSQECEPFLNDWPVTESHIDNFISDSSKDTTSYSQVLSQNLGSDNDGAVLVGWHALEYVLWGEDSTVPVNNQPGQRQYTDFTDTTSVGSSTLGQRRIQFLQTITQAIVGDLKRIRDGYANGSSFRTQLKQDPSGNLKKIVSGLNNFISGEWGGERLKGVFNGDQEDEHSCFSDNTKADFYYDAQSVINVWNGSYTLAKGSETETGKGLKDLFSSLNQPSSFLPDLQKARDKMCIDLGDETSDPNYVTNCPSGSLQDSFDYTIYQTGSNSPSQYSVLVSYSGLVSTTIWNEFVKAFQSIGLYQNSQ